MLDCNDVVRNRPAASSNFRSSVSTILRVHPADHRPSRTHFSSNQRLPSSASQVNLPVSVALQVSLAGRAVSDVDTGEQSGPSDARIWPSSIADLLICPKVSSNKRPRNIVDPVCASAVELGRRDGCVHSQTNGGKSAVGCQRLVVVKIVCQLNRVISN